MKYKITQIESNDKKIIDRLKEIDLQAFSDAGLDEWLLVPFLRHGRLMALHVDNKIVGSSVFFRDWGKPDRAYLFSIAIDSSFRGQGLGTQFLRECISIIKNQGVNFVELTVDSENHQAVRVYKEKLGFKTIARRENEYGEGEDRLVMELKL